MAARIQGNQRKGAGWTEFAGSEVVAAAGVRAPMKTTTPCTGGSTVSTYAFYESSRTQRRHARDHLVTGASSAMTSCGGGIRDSRSSALQREIDHGERGKMLRGSLRSRRASRQARGGGDDGKRAVGIHGGRR